MSIMMVMVNIKYVMIVMIVMMMVVIMVMMMGRGCEDDGYDACNDDNDEPGAGQVEAVVSRLPCACRCEPPCDLPHPGDHGS